MGCPVCGRGIDWSYWPKWWVISRGSNLLLSFSVAWMRHEYICPGCWYWADAAGARWDGKLPEMQFTGWKLA